MAVEASTPIGSGRAATAVTNAIRSAASQTGTSFNYLLATAKIESDLDPNLTMKSSSAAGLFQFIDQTWLGTLKQAPAAGALGPEQVPVPSGTTLASPAASVTGQDVDGISCQTSEQTLFHIHAHLTVFVNGTARQVPAAIGIPGAQAQATAAGPFIEQGKCFYWLHTHAADGIIHIESPVQRTFTLGNFFDVWGQPLSPTQVGPASGKVTAIYNGKLYTGNPRNIPLNAHAQIQLDVATPLIAPVTIGFPTGL